MIKSYRRMFQEVAYMLAAAAMLIFIAGVFGQEINKDLAYDMMILIGGIEVAIVILLGIHKGIEMFKKNRI